MIFAHQRGRDGAGRGNPGSRRRTNILRPPRETAPLLHDEELRQQGEDDHAEEHGVLQALDDVPAVRDGPRVELVEDLREKFRGKLLIHCRFSYLRVLGT